MAHSRRRASAGWARLAQGQVGPTAAAGPWPEAGCRAHPALHRVAARIGHGWSRAVERTLPLDDSDGVCKQGGGPAGAEMHSSAAAASGRAPPLGAGRRQALWDDSIGRSATARRGRNLRLAKRHGDAPLAHSWDSKFISNQ